MPSKLENISSAWLWLVRSNDVVSMWSVGLVASLLRAFLHENLKEVKL